MKGRGGDKGSEEGKKIFLFWEKNKGKEKQQENIKDDL